MSTSRPRTSASPSKSTAASRWNWVNRPVPAANLHVPGTDGSSEDARDGALAGGAAVLDRQHRLEVVEVRAAVIDLSSRWYRREGGLSNDAMSRRAIADFLEMERLQRRCRGRWNEDAEGDDRSAHREKLAYRLHGDPPNARRSRQRLDNRRLSRLSRPPYGGPAPRPDGLMKEI